MPICKNCNNVHELSYCNRCGEKTIETRDFTIKAILSQAIGSITNFDSKIFQSLKLLLFYPGKLTTKFVEGIRVPYMKPFQIFVISNILFFFFLSELDLFRTPSKWFFVESFDSIRVLDIVRDISKSTGMEITEIASKYDVKSSNLAKGLIFFLIPFIALIGNVLNLGKKVEFGKHVIFSTHYFSFVLVACVVINQINRTLITDFNKWFFIIPITVMMTLYYIIGLRTFYKNTWVAAIIKGIVGVFLINLFIQFYRVGINLLTLNTL